MIRNWMGRSIIRWRLAQSVAAVAIASIALLACRQDRPSTAGSTHFPDPLVIDSAGAYAHEGSGLVFPAGVQNFTRVRLVQYDTLAWDVSAGYDALDKQVPLTITVYVYPAPGITSIGSPQTVINGARATVFKNWFATEKAGVLHAHPGAKLIEERDASLEKGGVLTPGSIAVFDSPNDFNGMPIPTRTHLYLRGYVRDRWAVKFRFTHPKEFDADSSIAAFISALDWK